MVLVFTHTILTLASFPGSSPAFCRHTVHKPFYVQYATKSWGGAWERGYTNPWLGCCKQWTKDQWTVVDKVVKDQEALQASQGLLHP